MFGNFNLHNLKDWKITDNESKSWTPKIDQTSFLLKWKNSLAVSKNIENTFAGLTPFCSVSFFK